MPKDCNASNCPVFKDETPSNVTKKGSLLGTKPTEPKEKTPSNNLYANEILLDTTLNEQKEETLSKPTATTEESPSNLSVKESLLGATSKALEKENCKKCTCEVPPCLPGCEPPSQGCSDNTNNKKDICTNCYCSTGSCVPGCEKQKTIDQLDSANRKEEYPTAASDVTDENISTVNQHITDENISTVNQHITDENITTVNQHATDENITTVNQHATDENITTVNQHATDENIITVNQHATDENITTVNQQETQKHDPFESFNAEPGDVSQCLPKENNLQSDHIEGELEKQPNNLRQLIKKLDGDVAENVNELKLFDSKPDNTTKQNSTRNCNICSSSDNACVENCTVINPDFPDIIKPKKSLSDTDSKTYRDSKCFCKRHKEFSGNIFAKEASSFEATLSALELSLKILQEKCRAKDFIINALTEEVKLHSKTKSFGNLLKNVAQNQEPSCDFDKYTLAETLPKPKTNFAGPFFKSCICESTEEKNKNSCGCDVDSSPLEIIDIKRISQGCLLIRWKPAASEKILGYEICLEGITKMRVVGRERESTVIEHVKFKKENNITVFAFTKNGRCHPRVKSVYKILY